MADRVGNQLMPISFSSAPQFRLQTQGCEVQFHLVKLRNEMRLLCRVLGKELIYHLWWEKPSKPFPPPPSFLAINQKSSARAGASKDWRTFRAPVPFGWVPRSFLRRVPFSRPKKAHQKGGDFKSVLLTHPLMVFSLPYFNARAWAD